MTCFADTSTENVLSQELFSNELGIEKASFSNSDDLVTINAEPSQPVLYFGSLYPSGPVTMTLNKVAYDEMKFAMQVGGGAGAFSTVLLRLGGYRWTPQTMAAAAFVAGTWTVYSAFIEYQFSRNQEFATVVLPVHTNPDILIPLIPNY